MQSSGSAGFTARPYKAHYLNKIAGIVRAKLLEATPSPPNKIADIAIIKICAPRRGLVDAPAVRAGVPQANSSTEPQQDF